jgi:hypothetical protein
VKEAVVIQTTNIERGVPIPSPVQERPGKAPKYPFVSLECGESVGFDIDDNGYSRIRGAVSMVARTHGKKFSVRRLSPTSARVWRIA